jgi:hypothetical protein
VNTTLELQTGVSGENPTVSGSLTELLGESTSYSVTVPPDEAEALERGGRSVPNPVDPRTIRAGESVELAATRAGSTPTSTTRTSFGSGPGRNGSQGLQSLIDFMHGTTAGRHDLRDLPSEHPDSLLPGASVAPQCP